MIGVRAAFTHATIGVVMKPKPNGAVAFVVVVVEVLFVAVTWKTGRPAFIWFVEAC